MAVKNINGEKCIGCKICFKSCSMDVFRINSETGKAVVQYPEDCVLCCICLADCPVDAIEFDTKINWLFSGC